jgi:uncharacterized membrane protein YhaH (DUF805 family)
MRRLFSFKGRIRPLPYALLSLTFFFSQHLVTAGALKAFGQGVAADAWFFLVPLRSLSLRPLVVFDRQAGAIEMLILAYFLIVAWALSSLAFRRAADAGVSEWIAAYAFTPVIQIPVILFLCFAPSRGAADLAVEGREPSAAAPTWVPAAQGVIAGIGLTLFAVAVGALVFRSYGFGMFVISPFVIGATTAYFANRQSEIDTAQTVGLVLCATALGAIALIAFALEGAVCIIMAAPLGVLAALAGGALGRGIALSTKRSPAHTVSGIALLPLVFALESAFPAAISFDTSETIVVEAPPELVWKAIVRMEPIDAPLALPFRLGVAYPLGGEIIGEGVGALRRGEFSSGTAIERVTEWIPRRKLTFVVLNDVPSMRELSPYQHVHAPHVLGYFRTTSTSFELLPRPAGQTEIVERTSHELKLDPVFYWLALARRVVHENNARVLAHIRHQAERSFHADN